MPEPTEQLAGWKAKTDAAGEGWFEWFKMPENTTHIAYVHESGKVYDPENGWDQPEFVIAAAEGHVHKLIRVDEVAPLLAAVENVLALHVPETRYTAAGWEEVSFESRADAAEYGDTDNVQEFTVCHECGLIETHDGGEERCYEYSIWPCATVRAIESALEGGDDAK